MSGSIFFETLRRTWKGTLLWAAGVATMALYVILVIPDVKVLKQYGELIGNMPKFLLAAVGGDSIAAISSPEGFLGYAFFGWIMLVLAMYGVLAGLNITANEEDRGILDILISLPLPRSRIVLEKFAAYTINVVVIALVTFITTWIVMGSSTVFTISAGRLAEGMVNLIPATLINIAFTALVATIVRRRTMAASIAAVFVIASYVIDVIGRSAESAGKLRVVSFFTYYEGANVISNGASWGNIMLLLVVTALMIAGATLLFQRRDVGL